MKYCIFFLIIFFSGILNAQNAYEPDVNSIESVVQKFRNDPDLKCAGVGFYAMDVNSGEVVGQINPDMVLRPASNMKLISTATVLELYGADYKFKTTLLYDGEIDTVKRILHGNIYISGGGDPTLDSKYFDDYSALKIFSFWLDEMKKLKIDSVDGTLIGDADIYSEHLLPPTWSLEDVGNYFGAGACGLSFHDNLYSLFVKTAPKPDLPTQIIGMEPKIDNFVIKNEILSSYERGDNSYIFAVPYFYECYIIGTLPVNQQNFEIKGSLPDPCYFATQQFSSFLASNGIYFKSEPSTTRLIRNKNQVINYSRKLIATWYSPSLSEIITKTNLHSNNLFAEHCLNHIGLYKSGMGSNNSGKEYLVQFWQNSGMDVAGLSVNDGSGLSQYNAISAKQLVFVLNYMKKRSHNYDVFYNSLPIAGESGTLKNVARGTFAHGKIHAKSGTIRGVKSFSGYVVSKSGREIAFSMILNNFNCSSSAAKDKLEELMIALAKYNL